MSLLSTLYSLTSSSNTFLLRLTNLSSKLSDYMADRSQCGYTNLWSRSLLSRINKKALNHSQREGGIYVVCTLESSNWNQTRQWNTYTAFLYIIHITKSTYPGIYQSTGTRGCLFGWQWNQVFVNNQSSNDPNWFCFQITCILIVLTKAKVCTYTNETRILTHMFEINVVLPVS